MSKIKFMRLVVMPVFITVLTLGFLPARALSAEAVDRILIVVNDEVVTQREFDRVFQPIKKNVEEKFSGAELEAKLKEAEAGVKDHLINAKLATSLAKKKKIAIDEEELARRIETIKKTYYASEQEFLVALSDRGTNMSEFEKEIREQMLAQKLVQMEVASTIDVTPGEIREFYDGHIEEMNAPKQVLVRTIMIRKQDERSDEDTRKKMQEAMTQAKKTDDLSLLAIEISEGPYAKEGGKMGYIAEGQTVPEINDIIFALKQGEISEIVETPIGYHIFVVEEIKDARVLELSEVDGFLREQIYMKKFQEGLVKYLEDSRKEAYIAHK